MFFVAIEPYLLNTLNSSFTLFQFASILYAIDMTFLMGISAVLSQVLVKESERTASSSQMRTYRWSRNSKFIFAGLFLVSVIPQFFTWTLWVHPFEYSSGS
jgi:hypothetical protein